MKMTTDTRQHLALALQELTQDHKRIREYRQNVRYSKDQYTSFVWGLYYALDSPDKTAIRNNQGNPLHDSHIETALKRILQEYK